MPAETTLYPTKTLRYQICNFLLERRRREPTLGTPLAIKLQEMGPLLEYAAGEDDIERIEALGNELVLLNKERLGDMLEKTIIDILPPPISSSKDFVVAFKDNKTIEVRCLSKNIEEYIAELKNRTQAAIRNLGLAEITPLPSGGVEIILGDRKMRIGKSKGNNFNLSSNIVKLMYSGSVTVLGATFSLQDNYERKEFILFTDLLGVISNIEDDIDEDNQLKILKSIKDAVSNLNERSNEELGRPLFGIENEGLYWAL